MKKIYISSTYKDLIAERKAAANAALELKHFPLYMENYLACDDRPLDKCLQDVARCDAYIGIFAWRYGFIPHNHEKSITQLEYEKAREVGIPCLIFILAEDTPWPRTKMDKGPAQDKIETLRQTLTTDHTTAFFSTPDQLKAAISAALATTTFPSPAPPAPSPHPPQPPQTQSTQITAPLFTVPHSHTTAVNLARTKTLNLGRWEDLPQEREDNDIYFRFSNVSGRHCRLEYQPATQTITVSDSGSSYGTFVNEIQLKPNQPKELKHRDTIRLGKLLSLQLLIKKDFFILKHVTHHQKEGLAAWISSKDNPDQQLPPKDAQILFLTPNASHPIPIEGTQYTLKPNEKNGTIACNPPLTLTPEPVVF